MINDSLQYILFKCNLLIISENIENCEFYFENINNDILVDLVEKFDLKLKKNKNIKKPHCKVSNKKEIEEYLISKFDLESNYCFEKTTIKPIDNIIENSKDNIENSKNNIDEEAKDNSENSNDNSDEDAKDIDDIVIHNRAKRTITFEPVEKTITFDLMYNFILRGRQRNAIDLIIQYNFNNVFVSGFYGIEKDHIILSLILKMFVDRNKIIVFFT